MKTLRSIFNPAMGAALAVSLISLFVLPLHAQTPIPNLNMTVSVDSASGFYQRGNDVWVSISLDASTPLLTGPPPPNNPNYNVIGYQIALSYDPTVLSYFGVNTSVLCPFGGIVYPTGWSFQDNAPAPAGVALLAAWGTTPLGGSGCLRILHFKVLSNAPVGACSPLIIVSATFNTTQVGGVRTNSSACVRASGVSGEVLLWKPCLLPTQGIPGVLVRLRLGSGCCTGSIVCEDLTGGGLGAVGPQSGEYSCIGIPFQQHQLCFTRTNTAADYTLGANGGDVASAITADDAVQVGKYLTGQIALNECAFNTLNNPFFEYNCNPNCTPIVPTTVYPQREAADVDNDGQVLPYDAGVLQQAILAITLNQIPPAPFKKDWEFYCPDFNIPSLPPSPVDDVNDIGVLIGDVNGSYKNTDKTGKVEIAGVTLSIPRVRAEGRDVLVPLLLGGDPQGAAGVQARVGFDPAVLRFVSVSAGAGDPGLEAHSMVAEGAVAVLVFGLDGIRQPGTLAMLRFERLTPDGTPAKSVLDLSNARLGENWVRVENGLFSTEPVALAYRSWSFVKQLYKN